MEDKETRVTPRDLEDADPLQFQLLMEKVWDVFEKQLCEEAEATKMLTSAATTISSIGNYKKIEEDFNLGLLGEYVDRNEETLPFLATVMSHIHNQLERELQDSPSTAGHPPRCGMTTFLKELEDKMGADDATKNIVQEIAEMANLASGNLVTGNPEFSRLLMEVGDTMRDSWKSLRDEVEKCIRHARKKNHSKKNMNYIYKRIICKGLSSAKNIQEKIDSVSTSLDSRPASSTETADQMNTKTASPETSRPAEGAQSSSQEDAKTGSGSSPSFPSSKGNSSANSTSLKEKPSANKMNPSSRKENQNSKMSSKENSSAKINPPSYQETPSTKMSSKEDATASQRKK